MNRDAPPPLANLAFPTALLKTGESHIATALIVGMMWLPTLKKGDGRGICGGDFSEHPQILPVPPLPKEGTY
jgi:hypothetical protein